MIIPIVVRMRVSSSGSSVPMKVSADIATIRMSLGAQYNSSPKYQGEYNFIPSDEEQIAQTKGMELSENIRIAPIPSNWGRISYNGSVITVS